MSMTIEKYVELGYRLIPLKPGTKEPLYAEPFFTRGALDATTDLSKLNIYRENNHWGLVCHNCTVLDFDMYKGVTSEMVQLLDSLRIIERESPGVMCIQATKSGGIHIVIAKTEPLRLDIPNVDVRNSNQYICVEPTPGYEWKTTLYPPKNLLLYTPFIVACRGAETVPVELPPTITPTRDEWEAILQWLDRQDGAISGFGGHNQTYKVAYDLRVGFNLANDVVEWLLLNVYNSKCQPKWSLKEIQHKVESIKINIQPGYLLHTIQKPQEDANLIWRINRAGKYLSKCQVGLANYEKIITKMRIGFDLPAVIVLKLFELYQTEVALTEQFKDSVYNPVNIHNLEVGFMCKEYKNGQESES